MNVILSSNSRSRDCENFRHTLRARLIGEDNEDDWSASETHLAQCRSCRDYAAEMKSAIADLNTLQGASIEPGLSLTRKWKIAVTREIHSSTGPALPSFFTGFLRNNWKPSLAIATLWILIVAFNVNAPKPKPVQTGRSEWTPALVVRFFSAEREILAERHEWKF